MKPVLTILIRVDAALHIGSGHVMRCLTLAHALTRAQHSVVFVCREFNRHMCDEIRAAGFYCYALKVEPGGAFVGEHDSCWLGMSEEQDAEDTLQAIAGLSFDWVIIDHYSLGSQWQAKLRQRVDKVFVIDDLANRKHLADIVLDQGLIEGFERRYDGLLDRSSQALLGPKYALLSHEYRQAHHDAKNRPWPPQKVLIFFGGMDSNNFTGRALRAMLAIKGHWHVDVVTGKHNPHNDSIRDLVALHEGFTWHCNLPSLQPLISSADVSLGAGGITTYERLCLKLPSMAVAIAENQESAINYLDQLNLQHKLKADFCAQDLSDAMARLAKIDRRNLADVVDGLGAQRAVEAIEAATF